MDRLAMLKSMAQARPDDPFPTYGLAMELKKLGQLDEAKATFSSLLERHPTYVPSYLMFANLLVERGETPQATSILDRGIEVARNAGEEHALSELEAARAELS